MKVFYKASVILISLVSTAAFLALTGRFNAIEIIPDEPSFIPVSEPPWVSDTTSILSLEASITSSALEALVERLVPKQERGLNQVDFGRAFSGENVGWDLARTDIAISTADGLNVSASVGGTVQARGVFRPLRGAVGKLLGRATDVPFSQSARLQGSIAISSRPILMDNWRLNPDAGATLTIDQANLLIANTLPVSVSSIVERQVQPEVQKQMLKLNNHIAADPFLETAIKDIHEALCQTYVFEVEGTSAWLNSRPVHWRAGQPVLDERGLTLRLGLLLETSAGTGAPQHTPECPFPKNLEIAAAGDAGIIELKLTTNIEWQSIRNAANNQLAMLHQKHAEVFSNQFGSVTMDSLEVSEIRADGSSLLMKIPFKGALDSWWDRLFSGHVWLQMTPILDSHNQTVTFRDVQLDLSSEKALSASSAFGLIVGPMLENRLENLEPISLAEVGMKATSVANASVNKLISELDTADVEVLSNAVVETRLDGLHISEAGLNVLLVANGRMSLRINDISLGN